MTKATRRRITAVIVAVILLTLGAGVGVLVGDALGIRTDPATQMSTTPQQPIDAQPAVSARPMSVVAPTDPRTDAAVEALQDALDHALDSAEAGETDPMPLTVSAGAATDADDSYVVSADGDGLRVDAAGIAGAARALYDVAAAVRAERAVTDLVGEVAASALPLRMVDLGAVGVVADPAEWETGENYSHVSDAFRDVYLAEAPYIDADALAASFTQWEDYLRHVVSLGYNAVAWPGFLEYATLAGVYPEGDQHRDRSAALQAAFGPFWERAAELGVGVYLRTDMLALTPELEDHFVAELGSVDTEDPALWQAYTDALDELYAAHPALSGTVLRIGEAGDIYKTPGWDYYSALAVRTVPAVEAMLNAFVSQAEASGREVIFRTWSVGIGEVGDMHTDVDSYRAVLDDVSSPSLIVSTKYTLGDYYSWLGLNETLEIGDHRRIIEFQSRREFEAFGSFPNDLGPEFQWALQQLLAANPNIEGVWTWTQDGGPWRAGPMILYLESGFWQFAELNTQVAAALARDPDTDVGRVTEDWVRQWFSTDPATVGAITEAMSLSREAITEGLYIEPFAENRTFALGLEAPPQMWLFEWDILTGDSATLSVIYQTMSDRVEEAIAGGWNATESAERMRELITQTDAATWHDDALRTTFVDALDYEADVLGLLAAYREMFLYQAQWHATLSQDSYGSWAVARDAFQARVDAHLERYQGDVLHPSWNLTAAELGMARADRDAPMAWMSRALLVLAVGWLIVGAWVMRRRPGAAGALWTAATRPWRASETVSALTPVGRWSLALIPALLLVATRAVQTSFLSWTQLAIVLGAWAAFLIAVRLITWRRSPWPMIAVVAGVVMLRCILALAALSFTGPGGYWFVFWTDPVRRTAYIAVAFALFVWLFVAVGWALTTQIGARRATGTVLAAVGFGLAVPALIVAAVGLEPALTVWNDQMGLLPWGMARILGIATFLEIPDATAWYAAGFGAALVGVGAVLALPFRRATRVVTA